ncbi:MAG: glycosyltransferase family 4 protein [Lachnospiraceae bacterium]|nr:glycosyltransferase family 4 protein [Lachnospiraceae bacterium]
MIITWIVPHFPPHIGGGEKLYYDVCRQLVKRGCQVRVVTSSSGGIKGHRRIKGLDVFYCDWPLIFGHPLVKISDIVKHVRRADIVHTTIYSTAIKTNLVSAFYNKKCITTIHEVMGDKWFWFEKNPVKALAFGIYEKLIISLCPYVHAVSRATARDFEKYKGHCRHLFQIYNYLRLPAASVIEKEDIDFREVFSLKDDEKGILYFGRPAKNKGIFVLLKAIAAIKDKPMIRGKARFCMILADEPSDGRKEVMEFIADNGLSDMVSIRSSLPRTKLLKVISQSNLCVIPSVTEGFGYSAAEACALKRPVIASDGGSLKEVVSGKCRFFKNMDSCDLAEKLSDYIKYGTMGFLEIPERTFDRDKIIDQYMKMYRSLYKEK